MKIGLKYLILAILTIPAISGALFVFSGCSKSDSPVGDGSLSGTLLLAVEGQASLHVKTSVFDPDDLTLKGKQHVTRVHLYIFEQDGSGEDFTCVAAEDVKWTHLQGAVQGLETRRQKYKTLYSNYRNGSSYRFVAVGFDDTYSGPSDNPVFDNANSVEAFGMPENMASVGDKLSECRFVLRRDVSPETISRSELFCGAQTFTAAELNNGVSATRTLELNRRVAGIMGYFKNAPLEIGGKPAAKVVLRLYEPQNTETSFLPLLPAGMTAPEDVPDEKYMDYITSPYNGGPEDGRILASHDIVATSPVFTLSGYMLPCALPSEKYACTMELAILDADGNDLSVRKVLYDNPKKSPSTKNGTGIMGESHDLRFRYPVRANQFYRVGSVSAPIDLSGQTSDIVISIDPVWDEYYGGTMDGSRPDSGIGIDKEWGEHPGGVLNPSLQAVVLQ